MIRARELPRRVPGLLPRLVSKNADECVEFRLGFEKTRKTRLDRVDRRQVPSGDVLRQSARRWIAPGHRATILVCDGTARRCRNHRARSESICNTTTIQGLARYLRGAKSDRP